MPTSNHLLNHEKHGENSNGKFQQDVYPSLHLLSNIHNKDLQLCSNNTIMSINNMLPQLSQSAILESSTSATANVAAFVTHLPFWGNLQLLQVTQNTNERHWRQNIVLPHHYAPQTFCPHSLKTKRCVATSSCPPKLLSRILAMHCIIHQPHSTAKPYSP